MNTYLLLPPGGTYRGGFSNPLGPVHISRVKGGDYYNARARAVQHAIATGARRLLVVVGHARLVCAPLGGAQYVAGGLHQHGLCLYVDRLLREQAGAVLVPPLSAVKQVPPGWGLRMPVPPMVAAYSVSAVGCHNPAEPSLGYNLCKDGYRVLTLADYAYEQHGPTVLDEYGSATKWNRAYEQAIRAFL